MVATQFLCEFSTMHSSFMQKKKKKDFPDERKLSALSVPVPYDLFLSPIPVTIHLVGVSCDPK